MILQYLMKFFQPQSVNLETQKIFFVRRYTIAPKDPHEFRRTYCSSASIHVKHLTHHKKTNKLTQHTTPIAKTHRTATLFSSEPTENLKVHQYSSPKHHNIITITAASPPITETPQHHRHRAETSPTQNQGITHISPKHHNAITTHHRDTPETSPTHHLKITRTLLAHAEDILTHHQRITETSLGYHRIIHETQTKHNRDITETSPKHHQDITKT